MMMHVMPQETSFSPVDFGQVKNPAKPPEDKGMSFKDILSSYNPKAAAETGPQQTPVDQEKPQPKELDSSAVSQGDDVQDEVLPEDVMVSQYIALAQVPPELLLQFQLTGPDLAAQQDAGIVLTAENPVSLEGRSSQVLLQEITGDFPETGVVAREAAVSLAEGSEVILSQQEALPATSSGEVLKGNGSSFPVLPQINEGHTDSGAVKTDYGVVATVQEASADSPEVLPQLTEMPKNHAESDETVFLHNSTGGSLKTGEMAPGEKKSQAEPLLQPLEAKVDTSTTVIRGSAEPEMANGPEISWNGSGESSLSYDMAGNPAEVALPVTVPLDGDTPVSEEAFVTKLSQVLKDQLVSKSELITQQGRAEIRLELKPEYMGRVLLRLSLENGAINGKFLVENQQVRNLIENNIAQLKQNLADQGILWQEASVDVGGSGNNPFSNSDTSHGRNNNSRLRMSGEESLDIERAATSFGLALGRSISYLA